MRVQARSPLRARLATRRSKRGATITEYALLLTLLLVVAVGGYKFLGKSAGDAGFNRTDKVLKNGAPPPPPPPPPAAAEGAGGGAAAGGAGGAASTQDSTFGGPRGKVTHAEEGSPFVKFALIALGIIGLGATFFALSKGKHAGTG
jgi:Flp pilus assembly pilin Flp